VINFETSGLTSRMKYILIVTLTLLPFSGILVFVGVAAYLPTFRTMDQMIVVMMDEMVPLSTLQRSLLNAAMPPNDYILSKDPEEKVVFTEAAQKIEAAFVDLHNSYTGQPEVHEALDEAYTAWQHAFEDGSAILSDKLTHGSSDILLTMENFDADIQTVVDVLSEIHEITRNNLNAKNANIAAMKEKGILITVLAFLMALTLGVLGSVWLTRRHLSLEDQSMHDQLTGAYNRRACDEKLHEITSTVVSLGRPNFSLMMMDIDHFKAVNDTHGHQVGDETLQTVSKIVQGHLRTSDFFARFGGEEFLIIIPGADKSAAIELANRLRISIMETPIKAADDSTFTITMSLGVSEYPTDALSHSDLVKMADEALYQAKETGRNKVVGFGETPSEA